jgi:hypothetical protein
LNHDFAPWKSILSGKILILNLSKHKQTRWLLIFLLIIKIIWDYTCCSGEPKVKEKYLVYGKTFNVTGVEDRKSKSKLTVHRLGYKI